MYTFNRQGTIEDILLDNYLAELRKVIGDSVVKFDGITKEVIEALDFLGWLATLSTDIAITVETQMRIANELKTMADRILHTPQDYGDKNKISMADCADVEALIGTCLHLHRRIELNGIKYAIKDFNTSSYTKVHKLVAQVDDQGFCAWTKAVYDTATLVQWLEIWRYLAGVDEPSLKLHWLSVLQPAFSEPFYSSTTNDEVAQLQAELQKIVSTLYALWEEEYPSNVYISQAMAKRFAIIAVFEHIASWDSSMLQKTFVEQAIHEATVFEREVRLALCKELTF